MRIYVSYTSLDFEFADYLVYRLQQTGVPVWIDFQHSDTDPAEGLSDCSIMIVVLSPEATEDPQVLQEWHQSLEERRPVIAAVALPCTTTMPIKKYSDFTRDFERGFHRLMHLLFEQVQMLKRRF